MRGRLVASVLALSLALLVAGGVGTTTRAADSALNNGIEETLPSVVLVVQETSGTIVDSSGVVHGPYDLAYSGTGFFISGDGYVVTAGHVAAPTAGEIHNELVNPYIDERYNCNPDSAPDQCTGIEDRHSKDEMAVTRVGEHTTTVSVITQQMDPSGNGVPARIVSSSSSDQRDVAVLKINGSNEPVATLGTAANAAIGTAVAVIGYPASGQSNGPTTVTTTTTGSLNDVISPDGTRANAGGATLYQTDAHVEHGNSGGPAVDARGDVVGIVSFGNLQNVNYLISITDVLAVTGQTRAANSLGPIDNLWRQGLSALAGGDQSKAQSLFSQCAGLNPAQVYCAARAKGHALAGEPGSSVSPAGSAGSASINSSSLVAAVLVLLFTFLAVVLFGTFAARRQIGRPLPMPVGYHPGWPPPPGGAPGYGAWQGAVLPPPPRAYPFPPAYPGYTPPPGYPAQPGYPPPPGYPTQHGYPAPPGYPPLAPPSTTSAYPAVPGPPFAASAPPQPGQGPPPPSYGAPYYAPPGAATRPAAAAQGWAGTLPPAPPLRWPMSVVAPPTVPPAPPAPGQSPPPPAAS